MATPLIKTYGNFTGVDFLNESSNVAPNRSPDALNVWKDYNKEDVCIETRPGYVKKAEIRHETTVDNETVLEASPINGIYVFSGSEAIVHSGKYLYKWTNFPNTPTALTLTTIFTNMNVNNRTSFNRFGDKLYILDGTNYLKYDGTLSDVATNSFIPRTTIARSPSGGGERYQDVNLLQPKRINSFLADGTSTTYVLDAQNISSVDKVVVNDTEMTTGFSVNTTSGSVTFTAPPSVPAISGQDNVFITFTKEVSGYANRIKNCTKAVMFDDRLFFMGNPNYPNAIFHSELNNPSYISDLNYYEDGATDSPIKDIVVGNNLLWVFKNKDQNNKNVFYHTKDFDNEQGSIYPCAEGNVEVGCCGTAINFNDDIVYLSINGLEGIISTELESRQIISHRSSMVDPIMTNLTDYSDAHMVVWKGYLLILANGKVFLADSRAKYADQESFQYDWFYWELGCNPTILKEYDNRLFIGTSDGDIYELTGTNDAGSTTNSYWTTMFDNFGYLNRLKTTNKRGGIAKIRLTQGGAIKIARRTNKKGDYEFTKRQYLTGFSFNNINFAEWRFKNAYQNYVVFKIKEKKFNEISIKVYSDELNKPFALYSITIEAFVGGYIKK